MHYTTRLLLPLSALLSFCALLAACEHSEEPDLHDELATMPLRDVYGVDPSWVHDLSDETLQTLRTRTQARAHESDKGTPDPWLDAEARTTPSTLPAPYNIIPSDPGTSALRFDIHLQNTAQAPIPFAIYTHTEHGTQPFSCAPTHEELSTQLGTQLPTHWTDHTAAQHSGDRDALRSLSRGLETWRTRCLQTLRFPDHAPRTLHIHQQAHAPYLIAYWPQRHSLLINPILFALWGTQDNPPPSRTKPTSLQTRHAALTEFSDLDDCIGHFQARCLLCTREYATQNPEDCPPIELFSNSPIHEDCQALRFDLVDGFLKLCVQEFLLRPSIKACFESDTTQALCALPSGNDLVASPEALGRFYGPFSGGSSGQICRDTLDTCITNPQPNPDTGINRPPPPLCDPWEATTLEGQMWSVCLNDTYCNDLGGLMTDGDLCFYDPKRPKMNEVLCSEQQPSNCCGEQGEYPDYAREDCRIE